MIAFINLAYAPQSLFTGAILSEPMLLVIFNTFMTFFPIAYYAVSEKESYDITSMEHPGSLKFFKARYHPNFWRIALSLVNGFLYSQIIFWIGTLFFSSGMILNNGIQVDLYA